MNGELVGLNEFVDGPSFQGAYCMKNLMVLVTTAAMAAMATSASGASRTEALEYRDDASLWVLGQLASRSVNGITSEQNIFDGATAKPIQTLSFGKVVHTLDYNADGTIASVADGNGNVTVLGSWKRGIPQVVHNADGTSRSVVVDDNGWISHLTDENGYSTSYAYDSMGRLAHTQYPTADGVPRNPTTAAFEQVWGDEWGIGAGHWRQTIATGNGLKVTYFDALWRPLLVREFDAANELETQRFLRFAYDYQGRVAFASYPSASASPTSGEWKHYDAIGRVTSSSQDSEHGLLTTTTTYVPGLLTLVTSPKGVRTYTRYMAWDEPIYDYPIVIDQASGSAEEASIDITRDVFGKPTSIRKRNPSATVALTRHYVYDGHQELCKVIEPETGATVLAYDGAGNLAWSASGHHELNDPAHCHRDEGYAWGRRVDRSYDARNRLIALSYPDGVGNQNWTYTPDGLPEQIDTYQDAATRTINFYSYDPRRHLVGESSTQVDWYAWGVGYGYDANGHLASQTYPSGLTVEFAPNALGQPTQAGSYASGVQYHPNGAIRQFTYGNGVVHTMTQNARMLPSWEDSSFVQHYEYHYDVHGNPTAIYDHTNGGAFSRLMAYDSLDRLVEAGSASFGGDHWHRFSYDALDNLTSWTLAGVKDHAHYDYDPTTRRLSGIRNSEGTPLLSLGYDVQGNLQQRDGQTYQFDYGNRLRDVVGIENYRYDGHGRRVFSGRAGTYTVSMYGNNGELLFDHRQNNPLRASEYIYLGGRLIAQRELDESTNVSRVRYHHTDALGSPVAETDEVGTVVDRTHWEPYGTPIGKPSYDGVGFTGHVQDGATGLTYMQQRYYDPVLGVFLSVDPVSAYDNPFSQFHRYRYANNNPYMFTDPDGRQASDDRRNLPPPPEPTTLESVNVTASRPSVGSGGSQNSFANPRVPSFFRLTTTEALRSDRSSAQAIEDGGLTRTVTLPAMIVTASPSAVSLGVSTLPATGQATLVAGSTLYRSRTARELFFGCLVGIGVCQGNRPSMQRINQEERLQQAREGAMRETRRRTAEVP